MSNNHNALRSNRRRLDVQLKWEKHKFEKTKYWFNFFKIFLLSVSVIVFGKYVENGFKDRNLGLEEMKAFNNYVSIVLSSDDTEGRWLLSQFFATVTPSERLQEGWKAYQDSIRPDYLKAHALKQEKIGLQLHDKKSIQSEKRLKQIDKELEPFQRKILTTTPAIDAVYDYGRREAGQSNAIELNKLASKIKSQIQSSNRRFNLRASIDSAGRVFQNAINYIVKALGVFEVKDFRPTPGFSNYMYSCRTTIASTLNPSIEISSLYTVHFLPEKIVVSVGVDDEPQREIELPADTFNWAQVYDFICKFYIDRLNTYFQ